MGAARTRPRTDRRVDPIDLEAARAWGRPVAAYVAASLPAALSEAAARARIHTGDRVRRSARALEAAAFTFGSDVSLGEGHATGAERGRYVLVHELTHVAQNGAATEIPDHVGTAGDAAEREAHAIAAGDAVAVSRREPLLRRITDIVHEGLEQAAKGTEELGEAVIKSTGSQKP